MKRFLFLLVCGLPALFAGCKMQPERLQTGDLIFVGIPADYDLDADSMDSAIADATGSGVGLNLIHVAIADVDANGRWIIDATIKRGVDRHPLDTFLRDFTLKDGSLPVFEVKRLKDDRRAEEFVENVKQYLGQPYDVSFLPDNGAYYCTELVYDSYLDKDGAPLFQAAPMNFKNADGEFPLYWQQLFARIGEPIPQDIPGTNPQAMATEDILRSVAVELSPCTDPRGKAGGPGSPRRRAPRH